MARRDRRGIYAAALCAGALLCAATPAHAQYPTPPPAPAVPNPCLGERAAQLLCPDLLMGPPSQLFTSMGGGKVLLHAANDIRSRGEGPLEVRGTRTSRRYMSVRQAIYGRDKKAQVFDTPARLVFYNIPGQGPYWKFQNAAVFQIWSIGANGQRGELLRKGPKLSYCFRDLKRTDPGGRSPGKRVYPACSQRAGIKKRTLGTSVGWSDIYPSSYYQNWVNVRGLRGCFEFVMTADPLNHLFENDEENNEGSRRVRLPASPKGTVGSC